MPVEQLDLTVRTMNCLRRAGIATVGEIISKGEKELLKLRNFGQKSKQEIEERLKALGLSLTPQVEEGTEEGEAAELAAAGIGTETASPDESESEVGENQPAE